ncbi:MAG: T9SS type A sorting domain-containing protein [Flavicella sp.]
MKKITFLVAVLATTFSFGQINDGDFDFDTSHTFPGKSNYKVVIDDTNKASLGEKWFRFTANGLFTVTPEKKLIRTDMDKQNALGQYFYISNAGVYDFKVSVLVDKDANAVVSEGATAGSKKTIQFNILKNDGTLASKQPAFLSDGGQYDQLGVVVDPLNADGTTLNLVKKAYLAEGWYCLKYTFVTSLFTCPGGSTCGDSTVTIDDVSLEFDANATQTLASEANAVAGLSVYPNPASDVVNVSAAESIEAVSLVNALGQTVAAPFNGSSVDVAGLPNGVYILTVVAGGKSSAQKVVIK